MTREEAHRAALAALGHMHGWRPRWKRLDHAARQLRAASENLTGTDRETAQTWAQQVQAGGDGEAMMAGKLWGGFMGDAYWCGECRGKGRVEALAEPIRVVNVFDPNAEPEPPQRVMVSCEACDGRGWWRP